MNNGPTELDRPVPLYMQVVRQLRAQIASGELRDGDRLPSQREMMARWHISMQTASKVIGAMKTEGIAVPSVGRDTLRRTETRGDDGQATSITVTWYPPAIADRAPRLAGDQPLPAGTLAYIAEVTGNRAARADEDHAAGPAGEDAAAALGIAPGSPVLLTRTRHYTADGKLIEYAETTTAAGHRHTRAYTITGN